MPHLLGAGVAVAVHTVPTPLFTTRDQELQPFTRSVQRARRIAPSSGPADGGAEIDAGEAQLHRVGASPANAVAAWR